MPKILTRLKNQLRSKGVKNAKSIAERKLEEFGILRNGQLTEKGKKRNKMTPEERAKDRAVKYSGGKHQPSEYKYNKKTNRVKLKNK